MTETSSARPLEDDDAQQRAAIADRLRAERNRCGHTQEYVSELLGINRSSLSSIENGTRKVYATELRDLAYLYGVTVAYLLGGPSSDVVSESLATLNATWNFLGEGERNAVIMFAQFLHWQRTIGGE